MMISSIKEDQSRNSNIKIIAIIETKTIQFYWQENNKKFITIL